MRKVKHVLIGLTSVMFVCGTLFMFTPVEKRAEATGFFGKFKHDKCDVPPTWGEIINGKKRWVKKWHGKAFCDRMTGLVWEKSPSSEDMTWGVARFYCINRTVEGDKGKLGWRLASVQELASLVDTGSSDCPIGKGCLPNGNPFKNVQLDDIYWAATTFPGDSTQAWFVSFDIGNANCCLSTVVDPPFTETGLAWCVRGAPHGDVY